MKKIVTLMNFIRGSEPRVEVNLLETTKKQLELTNKYGLKTTYLLQYDAFTKKEYQNLFKEKNDLIEIGIWFELCQKLIEKIGLEWHGRYDWDYYLNVDNLLGYQKEKRERIIDEVFNEFFEVFGYFPKTIGSWILDSKSLEYIVKKYHIECNCICREQWGTDGITLFGGYYNQAYYPSLNNILCPSNKTNGIAVPTFRLLGCDPIYQYDGQLSFKNNDVFTLEPVWWLDNKTNKPLTIGGYNEKWIKWYFDSIYLHNFGMSFAYCQIGQENSFGWERMSEGLIKQYNQIKKLVDSKQVEALFLSESGRWFKEKFEISPVSTQVALNDYDNKNIKSIWYYSYKYRVNLYVDENEAKIRDMFIYNEEYINRYETKLITTPDAIFDNLPVMNGLKWSTDTNRAGIYFCKANGKKIKIIDFKYSEENNQAIALMHYDSGILKLCLNEDNISIKSDEPFLLKYHYVALLDDENISVENDKTICFNKRNFSYKISLTKGKIESKNIISEDNQIIVNL